ncbi:MAG: RIP metalloprotease RseP [Lachnospiraceae bacterium]|nr:RIP metalloprotease RseP [Lachnospiraceae bacterium]
MIRTIILFIIIFSIVVISHELGHFLIGRRNGIRVVEFSVGMGPTLFSFVKNGIKYSLKLLPIGGACMFDGEDGMGSEEEKPGGLYQKAGVEPDLLRAQKKDIGQDFAIDRESTGVSFPEAGVWRRIATVFAGPFFNFILAFMVAVVLTAFSGADLPVIGQLSENSAAGEAGLQPGDRITQIDHEKIHFYREVAVISALNQGEALEVTYERDGERGVVTVQPRYDEQSGRYYMGFVGAGEYLKCNPLQVFQYGFYEVEYYVKTTYKSLGQLLRGRVTKDDVSGPIGIAQFVGESYDHAEKNYGTSSAVLTMLEIVVLLSVNLGILNLLPLPALDGGRLLFMLVEVVRGKPVSPEKEGMVHFAGLVVLMILMVFIMYNDIMRLVH